MIVVSLFARVAYGQFSPGPLSKAHASLSGPSQCTSCHAVANSGSRFKCLECHTEMRERLAARRGLHPSLVRASAGEADCARCHSEHNGAAFVPIRWDVDLRHFDHSKTGYPLSGAHATLKCQACHTPEHIVAGEKTQIRIKDLRHTYLGLSPKCASCHEDVHRGQLSANCSQCHTETQWKPASGFDHAKAKFQLAGAHTNIACAKCHPTVPALKPYVQFTGLQFATCAPCHNDPHRGAFASVRCESCHSETSWKSVRVASQFDHSRTSYPLLGKHASVACEKCHRTSNFREPVAHTLCIDCHSTDAHEGQFLARADRGECSACHGVEGWRPARFGVAEHRATRYPLVARHEKVECAKCHIPAGVKTQYHIAFDRCGICHTDVHQEQFVASHGERCEDCHSVRGFRPSTFTVARHAHTEYPLEGAHAAIACSGCHSSGSAAGRFRFADHACQTCHADPHGGELRVAGNAVQARAKGAGCQACHSVRSWDDVSAFDHAATRFPLEGTHRAVPCARCHFAPDRGARVRNAVFQKIRGECAACHEDIHVGQFAGTAGQTDCARCHVALTWTAAARFDHNRESRFSLTGAHREVACARCHTQKRNSGGKLITMYRLAPHECSGCHGTEIAAN